MKFVILFYLFFSFISETCCGESEAQKITDIKTVLEKNTIQFDEFINVLISNYRVAKRIEQNLPTKQRIKKNVIKDNISIEDIVKILNIYDKNSNFQDFQYYVIREVINKRIDKDINEIIKGIKNTSSLKKMVSFLLEQKISDIETIFNNDQYVKMPFFRGLIKIKKNEPEYQINQLLSRSLLSDTVLEILKKIEKKIDDYIDAETSAPKIMRNIKKYDQNHEKEWINLVENYFIQVKNLSKTRTNIDDLKKIVQQIPSEVLFSIIIDKTIIKGFNNYIISMLSYEKIGSIIDDNAKSFELDNNIVNFLNKIKITLVNLKISNLISHAKKPESLAQILYFLFKNYIVSDKKRFDQFYQYFTNDQKLENAHIEKLFEQLLIKIKQLGQLESVIQEIQKIVTQKDFKKNIVNDLKNKVNSVERNSLIESKIKQAKDIINPYINRFQQLVPERFKLARVKSMFKTAGETALIALSLAAYFIMMKKLRKSLLF